MGAQKFVENKVVEELNRAFQERGAAYSLYYFVGTEQDADPRLLRAGKEVRYKL